MPEPEKKLPESLTFRFQYDADHRIVPVNGIWGGPTIRGDIRAEFFYEREVTPEVVTNLVTAEGGLGNEISRVPINRDVLRTVFVTLVFSPEQAESIGQWLMDKSRQLQAVRERKNADDSSER